MKYYIVDAFTDKPFGGNPAGVVLLEGQEFPEEGLMLLVAAELRYSETAFVRRDGGQVFTLRYFTPQAEVELCGHATIASFYLLHSLGLAKGQCLCHTRAGDLTVEAGKQVMMQMAEPRIVATLNEKDKTEAYSAVGTHLPRASNCPPLHPQIVYAGLPDIMLPVASLQELDALQPDMEAVAELSRRLNVVSIHAFAKANDGFTAHVRDFAPLYDIPEESATGTANASLTYYLAQNGLVPSTGECRFLQGEAMGRPSIVATRLDADGRLYVGGSAAVVAEGKFVCGNLSHKV